MLLSDLVVRKGKSVQVVRGHKTFSGGLLVHGAINASLINGVDVLAMNHSLLRVDEPLVITNSVVRVGTEVFFFSFFYSITRKKVRVREKISDRGRVVPTEVC